MTCEDCGREFTPVYKNKNAKYCRVCQVLGRLSFGGIRKKQCWGCDREFIPLSGHQNVCGRCFPAKSKHHVEGTCGVCGEERKDLLGEDVKVCSGCVGDPELQPAITKALLKKRAS